MARSGDEDLVRAIAAYRSAGTDAVERVQKELQCERITARQHVAMCLIVERFGVQGLLSEPEWAKISALIADPEIARGTGWRDISVLQRRKDPTALRRRIELVGKLWEKADGPGAEATSEPRMVRLGAEGEPPPIARDGLAQGGTGPADDGAPSSVTSPAEVPDAAALHRQHLARAAAQLAARLPVIPLPDVVVEQHVVRLGAAKEGPPPRSYGRLPLQKYLARHPEMGRVRDHCHTQAVWLRTQAWLEDRTVYLAALRGLAGRIWQDITGALDRDRAAGSIRPRELLTPSPGGAVQREWDGPELPSDLFVVPVLLATHPTLVSLGVDGRSLPSDFLRPAVDRAGPEGGYIKRERLEWFVTAYRTTPRRDVDFVRDNLPWPLGGWSRRAGELQERWRLELAGAPVVMDVCRQCAALIAARRELVAAFASLGPDDLRDGDCEQCRNPALPPPQF